MELYTFTMLTECKHCGNKVPFNGPLRELLCDSCQHTLKPTPAVWCSQLSSGAEGMRVLGNPYRCMDANSRYPQCPKCDQSFSVD